MIEQPDGTKPRDAWSDPRTTPPSPFNDLPDAYDAYDAYERSSSRTDSSHVDDTSDWAKDEAAIADLEQLDALLAQRAGIELRPLSCSVPAITRVWINRPNVMKPRDEQGKYPIFDVLLPDGRQILVWGVQWAGLTTMVHALDHAIMGKRAVAWIETSALVFVQIEKNGPFVDAGGV